jgi:hypothetical protein
MQIIEAACRGVLFVVFAVAVLGKAASAPRRRSFAAALAGFGIGHRARSPIAAVVIIGELVTVALLAFAPARGYVAAAAWLTVLTLVIARTLAAGAPAVCRCFGGSDSALALHHVVRNALLFGVAALALVVRPSSGGMGASDAGWWLATLVGTGAGGLVTRWDDIAYAFGFAARRRAS